MTDSQSPQHFKQDDNNWIDTEFNTIDLGCDRLYKRAAKVLHNFFVKPQSSIPEAMGSWPDSKSAYRFISNPKITPEKILQPHIDATQSRIHGQKIILAVQDTTDLNYTHHPCVKGLGTIGSSPKLRGMHVHTTMAFTPERVPLGLIAQQTWIRPVEEYGKKVTRISRPIEEKESYKWILSLNATETVQEKYPDTLLVNVGDREADIYDLFKLASKYKCELLVRASWNRRVDCVSVVTPTTSHHKIARDLLESGIHTLVEKPMTSTVTEAEDLIRVAKKSHAILQIGHIERFNPTIRSISSYLNSPRYVTADRVSPFPFRSVDVSVVMDVMIHDIDLVLALIGSEIKSVDAVGIPVISKVDDVVNARLRFENGAMAVITASRVSVKTERKLRIFQHDAYITLDLAGKKATIFRKGQKLIDGFDPSLFNPGKISNLKAFLFGDLIKIEKVKIDDKEPLRSELESFVGAVQKGIQPECSGEAGMKAIHVAEMIHAAIKKEPLWLDP